jgi:hypothetical protein
MYGETHSNMSANKKTSSIGYLALLFGFGVGAFALYHVSHGIAVPTPQKIACPFFLVLGLVVLRTSKQKAAASAA